MRIYLLVLIAEKQTLSMKLNLPNTEHDFRLLSTFIKLTNNCKIFKSDYWIHRLKKAHSTFLRPWIFLTIIWKWCCITEKMIKNQLLIVSNHKLRCLNFMIGNDEFFFWKVRCYCLKWYLWECEKTNSKKQDILKSIVKSQQKNKETFLEISSSSYTQPLIVKMIIYYCFKISKSKKKSVTKKLKSTHHTFTLNLIFDGICIHKSILQHNIKFGFHNFWR